MAGQDQLPVAHLREHRGEHDDHNVRVSGTNVTSFTVHDGNSDRSYDEWGVVDRDQESFFTDFKITVPPVGCP